jgi:hypothetical protein
MKKATIILSFLVFAIAGCELFGNHDVHNFKDMSANMMDIRIYHENLGDYIKYDKLEDAEWLLDGLDSILNLVSVKFPKHRKLSRSFEHYNRKLMREPISDLRSAIRKNDQAAAKKAYGVLTKKCNSCHIDHDIEKDVFNWAE